MNERHRNLAVNVVFAVLLTLLAVYLPGGATGDEGLLGFPEWVAPLALVGFIGLFKAHKLQSNRHTAVNVGVMVLSAILLLVPVPERLAEALHWWYPLGLGFFIALFVDLDGTKEVD